MKRYWLLPSVDDAFIVTSENRTITTVTEEGSTNILLNVGYYTIDELVDEITLRSDNKLLFAKVGYYNSTIKQKFIVLFVDESVTVLSGSFMDRFGEIDLIDDRDVMHSPLKHLPIYVYGGLERLAKIYDQKWLLTGL